MLFFFSSRRRHTRLVSDWSSDVCSSDRKALADRSARHGQGAHFYPQVPFWTDPGLIRNDPAAVGVAETMGKAPAIVVSVNGAVSAAETPAQALALAMFLEDAARVELAALSAGLADKAPRMSEDQAKTRATWQGRIAERMWDYLTAGDPE